MDDKFQNLGFTANYASNAFKILGNSMKVGGPGVENCTDTILRLTSSGSSIPLMSSSKGTKRKWSLIDSSMGQQVASSLSLGLGRSSSSSDSKGSSATACTTMSSAKETDEESSMDLELDFTLHLGNEKLPSPKKLGNSNLKAVELQPKVGLELSLSTGPSESEITNVHPNSTSLQSGMEMPLSVGGGQSADEGSTSCRWKPGIILQPLQTSSSPGDRFHSKQVPKHIDPAPIFQDLSSTILRRHVRLKDVEREPEVLLAAAYPMVAVVGVRNQDATRVLRAGQCTATANSLGGRCIAHGDAVMMVALELPEENRGCASGMVAARDVNKKTVQRVQKASQVFVSHMEVVAAAKLWDAQKGHREAQCFARHMVGESDALLQGAQRCRVCKGHGGCVACTKSVHGGTNFCVAHGGGKRCAMPECTKSARGRTDYCVRHGGGKRCKFEGCGKSAQGSTDFCKAHGGGKRCSWGHPGSEFGSQPTGPCNSFARGKTGLCALHSGILQDKRVHGGITLGPLVQDPKIGKPEKLKEAVVGEEMNVDIMKMGSSIETSAGGTCFDMKFGPFTGSFSVGEGRVHGGSHFIKVGSVLGTSSSRWSVIGEMSEPTKSYVMPQKWM
ncbi:hypothetical protein FNV43_RR09355 [Rhamnella rubrinervis]|uniref:WRKY19-like zinc finger domain-containing protein n=1 Tax=Rhamnella rubrinervis TaxID=2594499 RepID=A0A8K0MJX0_9ROSA|nr:hypothetical protein FNV43_RR09355 [Rhamnella rubrinervis]